MTLVDRADPQPQAEQAIDALRSAIRDLGPDPRLAPLMDAAVAATAGLAGVVSATITVPAPRSQLRTSARTDDLALVFETLQNQHGGPAVDTLHAGHDLVRIDDLDLEDRWPAFSAAARSASTIRTAVSHRLAVGTTSATVGSLNLYGTEPHAFDSVALAAGSRFAGYTAAVLSYCREQERAQNLEQALDSNRDIGVAVGILMTRRLITRDDAFARLAAESQARNTKLRTIAHDVIYTGDLPAASPPKSPPPRAG